MTKTHIYLYNDMLGIDLFESDNNGVLMGPPQIGSEAWVVDINYIEISPEAFTALQKVNKSHDHNGVMAILDFGSHIGFGWSGSNRIAVDITNEAFITSVDFDTDKLIDCLSNNIIVPEDFKELIDNQ